MKTFYVAIAAVASISLGGCCQYHCTMSYPHCASVTCAPTSVSQTPDPESRTPDPCPRPPDRGPWTLDPSPRTADTCVAANPCVLFDELVIGLMTSSQYPGSIPYAQWAQASSAPEISAPDTRAPHPCAVPETAELRPAEQCQTSVIACPVRKGSPHKAAKAACPEKTRDELRQSHKRSTSGKATDCRPVVVPNFYCK